MTEPLNLQTARAEKAHERLDVVEKRVNDLEKHSAVTDERMNSILVSIGKINSDTSWIVRLIIGGMILAVLAFFVKGGFHVQ